VLEYSSLFVAPWQPKRLEAWIEQESMLHCQSLACLLCEAQQLISKRWQGSASHSDDVMSCLMLGFAIIY
jgi:hypothetical protein